eukprot:Clim_evm37s55 gene=Clim_evmTU37s55
MSTQDHQQQPEFLKGLKVERQGAEARLYFTTFGNRKCVLKERLAKPWRHPVLDRKIRKGRLLHEARCILKAKKAGVAVPAIFHVSPAVGCLWIEYIGCPTVRDHLRQFQHSDTPETAQEVERVGKALGRAVAKLHAFEIMHGDLTTSNALWDADTADVIMIDFGLSAITTSAEDKGVDLYVLERAIRSTHPTLELFDHVISAYSMASEAMDDVKAAEAKTAIARFEEVRLRGRKRTMVG